MDPLAEIRRESDRFYALAAEADDSARRVPACPDWDVADLVWHLAEVHWFWATDVEQRASSPDEVEATKPTRPEGLPALIAFGRAEVDHLLQALEATADDVRVWTWALQDEQHCVGFVRRHQVQEAAVHRWDLEQALTGEPAAMAPEAAADSIDELLAITVPWCVRADKPLPGSVHLHCTDTEGEWLLHADGRVEAIHAKGDAALRGTASDLLLALYKRVPLDRIEVVGDPTVAAALVEAIGTE
jgi:uncharacterized protein (TIGR03083 family)